MLRCKFCLMDWLSLIPAIRKSLRRSEQDRCSTIQLLNNHGKESKALIPDLIDLLDVKEGTVGVAKMAAGALTEMVGLNDDAMKQLAAWLLDPRARSHDKRFLIGFLDRNAGLCPEAEQALVQISKSNDQMLSTAAKKALEGIRKEQEKQKGKK